MAGKVLLFQVPFTLHFVGSLWVCFLCFPARFGWNRATYDKEAPEELDEGGHPEHLCKGWYHKLSLIVLHHSLLFLSPLVEQTCWNRKLFLVVASCSRACSESGEWILCAVSSACLCLLPDIPNCLHKHIPHAAPAGVCAFPQQEPGNCLEGREGFLKTNKKKWQPPP